MCVCVCVCVSMSMHTLPSCGCLLTNLLSAVRYSYGTVFVFSLHSKTRERDGETEKEKTNKKRTANHMKGHHNDSPTGESEKAEAIMPQIMEAKSLIRPQTCSDIHTQAPPPPSQLSCPPSPPPLYSHHLPHPTSPPCPILFPTNVVSTHAQ